MVSRNLEPGQYQIGNFVFGRGTLFNVESFDTFGYDVNIQDYQGQLSDEIRFGSDSLKALPIQITMTARRNFLLENIAALTGDTNEYVFENDPTPNDFVREWRADATRKDWGALKPLYICRNDGTVLMAYGRPGKLSITKPIIKNDGPRQIIAEFRRSDTLLYSESEWFTALPPGEVVNIVRAQKLGMGNAPAWMRFLIFGPMINPILQIGSLTVELVEELGEDDVVEISSYPWSRRVINLNTGESLNAKLARPYLEDLAFPEETSAEVSWNATNVDFQQTRTIDTAPFTVGAWPTTVFDPVEYSGDGAGQIKIGNVPFSSNKAVLWEDSGNGNRWGTFLLKGTSETPYQHVEMFMPIAAEDNLFKEDPRNRIIGRSNDSKTEYLYWDITYHEAWFGYHKDGIDTIISEKININRCLQTLRSVIDQAFDGTFGSLFPAANWTYAADFGNGAGIMGSDLYINGYRVASSTKQPGNLSYRFGGLRVGFGMKATSRGWFEQATPGMIGDIKVWDVPPHNYDPALWNPNYVFPGRVLMLWRDAWHTL